MVLANFVVSRVNTIFISMLLGIWPISREVTNVFSNTLMVEVVPTNLVDTSRSLFRETLSVASSRKVPSVLAITVVVTTRRCRNWLCSS